MEKRNANFLLGEVGNWLRTGSLEDGGRNHLNAPLSDPQSTEGDICWSISQHARIVRGETHVLPVLQPLDPQQEPLNTQKSLNAQLFHECWSFTAICNQITQAMKGQTLPPSLYMSKLNKQGKLICCKECHSCTNLKPVAQHYLVIWLKLTSHKDEEAWEFS